MFFKSNLFKLGIGILLGMIVFFIPARKGRNIKSPEMPGKSYMRR